MKNRIVTLLIVSILAVSCKKEPLPQPVKAEPVFYLKADINGTPAISLEAGNNGVRLNSSYTRQNNNLYVYQAEFLNACAVNCGYKVKIMLNDYRLSPPNSDMKIDSALHPGTYKIFDAAKVPTTQKVILSPNIKYAGEGDYLWTIVDDKGESTFNSQTVSRTFDIGRTYTASLRFIDFSGSCQSTVSSVFTVGAPFQAFINAEKDGAEAAYKFVAVTDWEGDYEYDWDFGDGSTGTGKVVHHVYSDLSGIPFNVVLKVKDKIGKMVATNYCVTAGQSCEVNIVRNFIPNDLSYLLSAFTFVITDPAGNDYSSADAAQAVSSRVEITEVSDYLLNPSGQPTKKVKLLFECAVKNNKDEVLMAKGETVMAMAYQ